MKIFFPILVLACCLYGSVALAGEQAAAEVQCENGKCRRVQTVVTKTKAVVAAALTPVAAVVTAPIEAVRSSGCNCGPACGCSGCQPVSESSCCEPAAVSVTQVVRVRQTRCAGLRVRTVCRQRSHGCR